EAAHRCASGTLVIRRRSAARRALCRSFVRTSCSLIVEGPIYRPEATRGRSSAGRAAWGSRSGEATLRVVAVLLTLGEQSGGRRRRRGVEQGRDEVGEVGGEQAVVLARLAGGAARELDEAEADGRVAGVQHGPLLGRHERVEQRVAAAAAVVRAGGPGAGRQQEGARGGR